MFTTLDGRSVIVTGGSKGIGKGIAAVFVGAGANVLLAARDEAALGSAAEQLAAGARGRVETVVADVSRVDDCRRLADTAVDRFGGIDVLCANAGIFPDKPLVDLTEEDVDAVLGCNLKGVGARESKDRHVRCFSSIQAGEDRVRLLAQLDCGNILEANERGSDIVLYNDRVAYDVWFRRD